MAKVSVIIVNWNSEKFIRKCLVALRGQIFPPFEIIVVDNASSDNSLQILKEFPDIKIISLSSNLGFARANNIGIQECSLQADWVALLNPDAFASTNWLMELVNAAQTSPDYKIFGSKLLNAVNPKIIDGLGDSYHFSGLPWRIGHGAIDLNGQDSNIEIFSACAAAAMYCRKALVSVGGFDEDYFCYVEDVDLGFRLRLAGHKCMFVPKSVALHVGSGSTGGQHSDFARYYGHRNLVWTFFKNMPGILFWIMLPAHLFLNIFSIFYLAFRGQFRVVFRAKRDAILELPKVWKKRKAIQKNRVIPIFAIWELLAKNFRTRRP